MKLYTPKQTTKILNISLQSLFNYLRDCDYWYFSKRQQKYLPYAKYCKPKKRGRNFKEEYFTLREYTTTDNKKTRIGLITERGLKMLKDENIPSHYI